MTTGRDSLESLLTETNGNQDNLEIDLGAIIINTCTHERGAVHSVGATCKDVCHQHGADGGRAALDMRGADRDVAEVCRKNNHKREINKGSSCQKEIGSRTAGFKSLLKHSFLKHEILVSL